MDIITILGNIRSQLTALLAIVSSFRGALFGVATEIEPYMIQNAANRAVGILDGDFPGVIATQDSLDILADNQAAGFNLVLAALTRITDGTDPISLPTEPPTGYGGASASDISDQVWNDHQPNMESTPLDALQQIARSVNTTGVFDMPLYVGIFQVARIEWNLTDIYIHDLEYPTFDPSDIGPEETLLDVLTRQNPTWTCSNSWSPQSFVSLAPGSGGTVYYTTTIDESDFRAMKRNIGLVAESVQLPAWPGSDFVTMLDPVDLEAGLTISQPCHGVIVNITGVPLRAGFWDFNGQFSYRNLGAIAFVSDHGEVEYAQSLGFTQSVYCPRTMAKAEQILVRCAGGVSGTITPWVVATV